MYTNMDGLSRYAAKGKITAQNRVNSILSIIHVIKHMHA